MEENNQQAQTPPSFVPPTQPKPKLSRRLKIVLVVALVLLVGLVGFVLLKPDKKQPNAYQSNDQTNQAATPSTHPDTIRLIATGDFIAHDSVNKNALRGDGRYDYMQFMQDFVPVFKAAGIRFCNDPILNGGKEFGITGYPKFNSPTEFVNDMKSLGCNMVNTASNHSFDKSQAVIDASVDAWDHQGSMLAVAGQNKDQAGHNAVHSFTLNGVKFAFLAYTTYINQDAAVHNNYGVNVFSKDFAAKQIAEAKRQGAKVIIASMRWGTEYSNVLTAEEKGDAQLLSDQGVSLILGHGTHVLQPVAQLTGSGGNKTIVWYGLGNFLNTQEPADTLFGAVGVVDFKVSDGSISSVGYLPIYMHYEWTAAQQKADDLLARNNLHLYPLELADQSMIDKNQLSTTISAQENRIKQTLNSLTKVKRYSLADYYQ